jgi:hypothetical protein
VPIAENLIKLHKAQLASDRTSCRSPLANQMRLILHTAAYWLMLTVRDATGSGQGVPDARCRLDNPRAELQKTQSNGGELGLGERVCLWDPDASLIRHIAAALMPTGP